MVELDEQTREILRDSSLTPYGKFMFPARALSAPDGQLVFGSNGLSGLCS